MEKTKTSSYRLEYLDWVRGIGAVIMLQGHVLHSFLRPELKTTGAYTLSQFAGGMPPALFLFLTGVPHGQHRAQGPGARRARYAIAAPRRLSFLPGFRLPPATLGLRFPRPLAGPVQGRCAELHGTGDRAALRDGLVQDGGTHSPVRRTRPGDRPALPGDLRNGLVRRAVDRPQLHHPRLQWVRYLPLGRLPGLRRQRRLCDSRHPARLY